VFYGQPAVILQSCHVFSQLAGLITALPLPKSRSI
jgi:hypothetical protein